MGQMRTEDKILEALRETDARVLTSSEIAEEIGVTKPTVYHHIQRLVGAGRVQERKVGQATAYWFETADEDGKDEADERADRFGGENTVAVDMDSRVRLFGGALLGLLLLSAVVYWVFSSGVVVAQVLFAAGVAIYGVAQLVEALDSRRLRASPEEATNGSPDA